MKESFNLKSKPLEKIISLPKKLPYVVPAKDDCVEFFLIVKELDNLFATCKRRIRFLGWGQKGKQNLLDRFVFKPKFIYKVELERLDSFKKKADFLVEKINKFLNYYPQYYSKENLGKKDVEKIKKKIEDIDYYIKKQKLSGNNSVAELIDSQERLEINNSEIPNEAKCITIYEKAVAEYENLVKEFRRNFKKEREEFKTDTDRKKLQIRVKKLYFAVLKCSAIVNDLLAEFEGSVLYAKYGNEIDKLHSQVLSFCANFKKSYTEAKTCLVYANGDKVGDELMLEMKIALNEFRDKIYVMHSCCQRPYPEETRVDKLKNLDLITKSLPGKFNLLLQKALLLNSEGKKGQTPISTRAKGFSSMNALCENCTKEINALEEMTDEFNQLLTSPSGARMLYRKWRIFLKMVAMKYMPCVSQFAMILGAMIGSTNKSNKPTV